MRKGPPARVTLGFYPNIVIGKPQRRTIAVNSENLCL
jgi:hypothetical protein